MHTGTAEQNASNRPGKIPGLFALGFRPFFLVAGLSAVLLMMAWLLVLSGKLAPGAYMPSDLWHAHAMIFGFIAAGICGFLLTAVQAWTG